MITWSGTTLCEVEPFGLCTGNVSSMYTTNGSFLLHACVVVLPGDLANVPYAIMWNVCVNSVAHLC